jgi:serine/threonine-protein kinase
MPQNPPETSIDASGDQLQVGQLVDRYVVESIIGSGGTATVYRVAHRDLGTVHALKVLTLLSPSIRRRTLQEGRVQASMQHRNIVAVYDVLEIGDAPGLLMEFVEGPSLEVALERYHFTLKQAEVLFRGVLEGVREAHGLGLVHRDLKPANVMLADTPKGVVPKVTDFGIAKVVESEVTSHTRAGIAMGTPQYMSPEQIRDAKSVDQRADIFSLGCLLYELVTHQRTFPYDDIVKVYNAVCDGEFTPPREIVPDLPQRFENAIMGCLKVDRSTRIPDCDVLRDVFDGRVVWGDDDTTEVVEDVESLVSHFDNNDPAAAYLSPDLIRQIVDEPDDLDTSDLADEFQDDKTTPKLPTFNHDVDPEPSVDWTLYAISAMLLLAGLFGMWQLNPLTPQTDTAPVTVLAAEQRDAPEDEASPEDLAQQELAGGSKPARLNTAAPTTGSQTGDPSSNTPVLRMSEKPVAPTPERAAVGEVTPPVSKVTKPTATPVPKQVPPERIMVKLLSRPPTARIWIDGRDMGRTPHKDNLTPGKHAVRMQSGEEEVGFAIDVKPETGNRWCFVFGEDAPIAGRCP